MSTSQREERLGQVEDKMKRKDGRGGKGRKTDEDRVSDKGMKTGKMDMRFSLKLETYTSEMDGL